MSERISLEQFTDRVMRRLPVIEDERDRNVIMANMYQFYDDEFTVNDAVAYLKCMEEVSPELEEEVALARMKRISDKYPKAVRRRSHDI